MVFTLWPLKGRRGLRPLGHLTGGVAVGRVAGLNTTQETEAEGPKNIVPCEPGEVGAGEPEMEVTKAAAMDTSTVPVAHINRRHGVSPPRPELDPKGWFGVCWLT